MTQKSYLERLSRAAALAVAISFAAAAQAQHTKGAVLERLEGIYVPTQTTDDQSDIATAGSVLTLKKDNLVTVGLNSGSICPNTYKDGRITQSTLAKVTCGRALSATGQAKRKVFLAGQKLWVTAIEVKDDGITFRLYTDAYLGERYKATLVFPFGKGNQPSPDEAASLVGEVFKAGPPPTQASDPAQTPAQNPRDTPAAKPVPAGGNPIPTPAPPPAAAGAEEKPLPPIDAPPPPPAPPQVITLGMGQPQVELILGRPEKIVKLGTKEMYFYSNLKVTFVSNKVTDVE